MTVEEPTPGEIEAYVAGQLDVGREFVVETHLSRHPDQAARVMADFGAASALKLLFGKPGGAGGAPVRRTEGQDHAQRPSSQRPSSRRRRTVMVGLSGGALAAVLAGVYLMPAGPPDYIDYAVSSHRIAALRANMDSQIETTLYDAREIASSTQISVPPLPGSWRVTDVQLFPTAKGAALVMALKTPAGEPVSLFAIRQRSDAPERPDAVREGAQSVAYWRHGEMSYALTGETDPFAIDATAESLVRESF